MPLRRVPPTHRTRPINRPQLTGALAPTVAATPVDGPVLDLNWDLRSQVDGPVLDLNWDLRSQVDGAVTELIWDLRSQVDGAVTELIWDLIAQANSPVTELIWDLRAAVDANSLELIWDAGAEVNGAPQELIWDLVAQVNSTVMDLIWDLRSAVDGGILDFKWDLRSAVDGLADTLLDDFDRADSPILGTVTSEMTLLDDHNRADEDPATGYSPPGNSAFSWQAGEPLRIVGNEIVGVNGSYLGGLLDAAVEGPAGFSMKLTELDAGSGYADAYMALMSDPFTSNVRVECDVEPAEWYGPGTGWILTAYEFNAANSAIHSYQSEVPVEEGDTIAVWSDTVTAKALLKKPGGAWSVVHEWELVGTLGSGPYSVDVAVGSGGTGRASIDDLRGETGFHFSDWGAPSLWGPLAIEDNAADTPGSEPTGGQIWGEYFTAPVFASCRLLNGSNWFYMSVCEPTPPAPGIGGYELEIQPAPAHLWTIYQNTDFPDFPHYDVQVYQEVSDGDYVGISFDGTEAAAWWRASAGGDWVKVTAFNPPDASMVTGGAAIFTSEGFPVDDYTVATAPQFVWDTYAAVDGAAQELIWDLTAQVNGGILDLIWDIGGFVDGPELELLWDIGGSVDGGILDLIWDTRAAVDGSALDLIWDLRAAVDGSGLDLIWDLASQTNADPLDLIWDAAGQVNAPPLQVIWDTIAQVNGGVLDLIWNTRLAVDSASLEILWDLAAAVENALTLKWDMDAEAPEASPQHEGLRRGLVAAIILNGLVQHLDVRRGTVTAPIQTGGSVATLSGGMPSTSEKSGTIDSRGLTGGEVQEPMTSG